MPTSTKVTRKQYANFYNFEKAYNNVAKEGGISFRNGKKPEELLRFLMDLFSNEKDIILDYHLGSGTTAAVAHKMNRQYIGIEQMDYGENDSIVRLKNVVGKKEMIRENLTEIDFDSTGISKTVNYQGGGSFVYFELAKYNEKAKELILECSDLASLKTLFETLSANYFLHYNLSIQAFQKEIIRDERFENLSLLKQKEIFLTILDLNQMYVNFTEMQDEKHRLTKADIDLTKDFYS